MTRIINNVILNEAIVCPEEGADVINCKHGSTKGIQGGAGVDFIQNDGFVFGAISSGSGDTTIINANVIRGAVVLGAGNNLMINNGSVEPDSESSEIPRIEGNVGTDKIVNVGIISEGIYENAGNNYVINKGTTKKIYGGSGDNVIINDGFVTNITETVNEKGETVRTEEGFINVGNGNNIITNTGTVGSIIVGSGDNEISNDGICLKINLGIGNNTVYIFPTSETGAINFSDTGNTTLYLTADENYLVFGYNKDYEWDGNDLVITYNNTAKAIIKNYNPDDTGIKVYVDGSDLAELVPSKEE